jgi:hypothetical protein
MKQHFLLVGMQTGAVTMCMDLKMDTERLNVIMSVRCVITLEKIKVTAVRDFKDRNSCCGSNPTTDVRHTFQKYEG